MTESDLTPLQEARKESAQALKGVLYALGALVAAFAITAGLIAFAFGPPIAIAEVVANAVGVEHDLYRMQIGLLAVILWIAVVVIPVAAGANSLLDSYLKESDDETGGKEESS